jgi:hypothetical protein
MIKVPGPNVSAWAAGAANDVTARIPTRKRFFIRCTDPELERRSRDGERTPVNTSLRPMPERA